MERTALVTKARFAGALERSKHVRHGGARISTQENKKQSRSTYQLSKVFRRFRNDIGTQLKLDTTNVFSTHFHVKKYCR
jgi:hypothetical protein